MLSRKWLQTIAATAASLLIAVTVPFAVSAAQNEFDNIVISSPAGLFSDIAPALVDKFGDTFPSYLVYESFGFTSTTTDRGYIIIAKDIEINIFSYNTETDRIQMAATITAGFMYNIQWDNTAKTFTLKLRYSSIFNYESPTRVNVIYTNGRSNDNLLGNIYDVGGLWYPYESALLTAKGKSNDTAGQMAANMALLVDQQNENHQALMQELTDIHADIRGAWNTLLTILQSNLHEFDRQKERWDELLGLLEDVFSETEAQSAAREWADKISDEYAEQSTQVGNQVVSAGNAQLGTPAEKEALTELLKLPQSLVSIMLVAITCILVAFGVKKGMS